MVFCDEKNIEFLSTRNETVYGTSQLLFNPKTHIDKFIDSWRYYAKANDIAKREKLKMALRDALHSIERPQKHSVVNEVDANSVKRIKEAAVLLKEFKEMESLSETVKKTLGAYKDARLRIKAKSESKKKRNRIPRYRSRKSFINRAVNPDWLPSGKIKLTKPVVIKRTNRISVKANPLANGKVGIEYSSIDYRLSNVEQAEKAMRAAVIVLKYSDTNRKESIKEDEIKSPETKTKTVTKTIIPGSGGGSGKPAVSSVVESLVNGDDDLPGQDKAAISSLDKEKDQVKDVITSRHKSKNVKKEIVNKYVGQLKQLYARYLKIKGENDTVDNALQFQNEIINNNLGNVSRNLIENDFESTKKESDPTGDNKDKTDSKSDVSDDDKYIAKTLNDDPAIAKQDDTIKQLKEARLAKVKYELAKHELAHKIKELYMLANNYEKDETENQILEVKNLISHTPSKNKGEVIPGARASEKSSIDKPTLTQTNDTLDNIIAQRDDVHPGMGLSGLLHESNDKKTPEASNDAQKSFTMGMEDKSSHQVDLTSRFATVDDGKSDYDYLHLPSEHTADLKKEGDDKEKAKKEEQSKPKNDDETLSIIAQAIKEDMSEMQKDKNEGEKTIAASSMLSSFDKKPLTNGSEDHESKPTNKLTDIKEKEVEKPKHNTGNTKQDLSYNNETVDDYLTKALSDIISHDTLNNDPNPATQTDATLSDAVKTETASVKEEDPSEKNKQIVEKAMRQHAKNPNLPLPLVDTKGDKIKLNPALNDSVSDFKNDSITSTPTDNSQAEPDKAASPAPETKQPAAATKETKPTKPIPTDVLLHVTDKNVSTALPDIDLRDPENKKLLEKASHMEESIAAAQDKLYTEIDTKSNEQEIDGHKVAPATETNANDKDQGNREEVASRDTMSSVRDSRPIADRLPSTSDSSMLIREDTEAPTRSLFRHQSDPYVGIQEHPTLSNNMDIADFESDDVLEHAVPGVRQIRSVRPFKKNQASKRDNLAQTVFIPPGKQIVSSDVADRPVYMPPLQMSSCKQGQYGSMLNQEFMTQPNVAESKVNCGPILPMEGGMTPGSQPNSLPAGNEISSSIMKELSNEFMSNDMPKPNTVQYSFMGSSQPTDYLNQVTSSNQENQMASSNQGNAMTSSYNIPPMNNNSDEKPSEMDLIDQSMKGTENTDNNMFANIGKKHNGANMGFNDQHMIHDSNRGNNNKNNDDNNNEDDNDDDDNDNDDDDDDEDDNGDDSKGTESKNSDNKDGIEDSNSNHFDGKQNDDANENGDSNNEHNNNDDLNENHGPPVGFDSEEHGFWNQQNNPMQNIQTFAHKLKDQLTAEKKEQEEGKQMKSENGNYHGMALLHGNTHQDNIHSLKQKRSLSDIPLPPLPPLQLTEGDPNAQSTFDTLENHALMYQDSLAFVNPYSDKYTRLLGGPLTKTMKTLQRSFVDHNQPYYNRQPFHKMNVPMTPRAYKQPANIYAHTYNALSGRPRGVIDAITHPKFRRHPHHRHHHHRRGFGFHKTYPPTYNSEYGQAPDQYFVNSLRNQFMNNRPSVNNQQRSFQPTWGNQRGTYVTPRRRYREGGSFPGINPISPLSWNAQQRSFYGENTHQPYQPYDIHRNMYRQSSFHGKPELFYEPRLYDEHPPVGRDMYDGGLIDRSYMNRDFGWNNKRWKQRGEPMYNPNVSQRNVPYFTEDQYERQLPQNEGVHNWGQIPFMFPERPDPTIAECGPACLNENSLQHARNEIQNRDNYQYFHHEQSDPSLDDFAETLTKHLVAENRRIRKKKKLDLESMDNGQKRNFQTKTKPKIAPLRSDVPSQVFVPPGKDQGDFVQNQKADPNISFMMNSDAYTDDNLSALQEHAFMKQRHLANNPLEFGSTPGGELDNSHRKHYLPKQHYQTQHFDPSAIQDSGQLVNQAISNSPMTDMDIQDVGNNLAQYKEAYPHQSINKLALALEDRRRLLSGQKGYDDEEPPEVGHHAHHHHHHLPHHNHHHRRHHHDEEAEDDVAPDDAVEEEEEEEDSPEDDDDEDDEEDDDRRYNKKSNIKYIDNRADKRSFNNTASLPQNSSAVPLLKYDAIDHVGTIEPEHIDELEDTKRSQIPLKQHKIKNKKNVIDQHLTTSKAAKENIDLNKKYIVKNIERSSIMKKKKRQKRRKIFR